MPTNTEEILIRMGLDSTAVTSGLGRVKHTIKDQFKDIAGEITKAFGVGVILAGVERVINKFDELKDRADNLEIGTDFLQGMEHIAGKDAVGGAQTFSKAISELSVRLGSAKEGSEQAQKAFEKYGITVGDIASMNSEEMFYRIADAIKNIPDPAQRTNAAFELLGKSGKNLAGVLAGGGENLKRMVEAVDKLDADKVKTLAEAKDQLEELGNTLTTWGGGAVANIANVFKELGRLTTGFDTVRKASTEEAHQWMQDVMKRAVDKSNAKLAAEDAALKKMDADKKAASDKEIAEADKRFEKLTKHEDAETDRLFAIGLLKRSLLGMDAQSVEYHKVRADLAELEAEQEKFITDEKKKQANIDDLKHGKKQAQDEINGLNGLYPSDQQIHDNANVEKPIPIESNPAVDDYRNRHNLNNQKNNALNWGTFNDAVNAMGGNPNAPEAYTPDQLVQGIKEGEADRANARLAGDTDRFNYDNNRIKQFEDALRNAGLRPETTAQKIAELKTVMESIDNKLKDLGVTIKDQ